MLSRQYLHVYLILFACLFAWLPVSHSRDVAILKFLIVLDSGCAHALLGCPGTKCSCSSLISETCWLWPGDGGLFNYSIKLYSMIRGFFMVFLQDQMFDICKWCHARILHMRLHGMIWTVIHCDSTDKDEIDWDWQDVKEPSPSQSRHKASRKGTNFGAMWNWNDEVTEGSFGYFWQQLDLLS